MNGNDNAEGNIMQSVSRGAANPYEELPAGLAMALAQNTAALTRFTNLTTQAQDDIIRRARNVRTRNDMRRLVDTIGSSPTM